MTTVIKTFNHKSASVGLLIDEERRVARVHNLYSVSRNKGHASILMNKVTEYADENNLDLFLEAKRYGTTQGLDNQRLMDFYANFGFVRTKGTQCAMTRVHIPVTSVTEVTNVTGVTPSQE